MKITISGWSTNSNLGDRDYLGQDYFKTHDVQLDLGEVQEFTVVAMTSSYYYAWQIEMEVEAGGRKNYVTIGLDGDKKPDPTPFKISARADSRSNRRGSFAVYKELYVLDDTTNRAGFTTVDPRTFAP